MRKIGFRYEDTDLRGNASSCYRGEPIKTDIGAILAHKFSLPAAAPEIVPSLSIGPVIAIGKALKKWAKFPDYMRNLRRTRTPRYVAVNRRTYDTMAEEYERRMQCMSPYEDSPEILGGSILRHISASCTRGKMLEIGPGAGQTLKYFAEKGFYTVGVELSKKMADVAQKTSPKSKIINKNILDYSVDEKFEIIYMGAIIHLFPKGDAAALIKKTHKLLASNGILFVNTTISKKSSEGYSIKMDYKNQCERFRKQWTKKELNNLLLQNNYKIIQELYNNEADRKKEWVAFICSKSNSGQQ